MAITAIKTGAKLPIKPSAEGKPPDMSIKQVVVVIPSCIQISSLQPYCFCPEPPFQYLKSVNNVCALTVEEEAEPEVFEEESTVHT
jgi:thiamine biosynthesis lipoprotein ApbE